MVLLDLHSDLNFCCGSRCFRPPFETRHRQYEKVSRMYSCPLSSSDERGDRKLLAVDFIGAALTLAACALLLLPLIWVCSNYLSFCKGHANSSSKGGITFPWSSAVVLAPLFSGILVVGLFCVWEWKGARLPIVPSQ